MVRFVISCIAGLVCGRLFGRWNHRQPALGPGKYDGP